jgi:hypothetical protein
VIETGAAAGRGVLRHRAVNEHGIADRDFYAEPWPRVTDVAADGAVDQSEGAALAQDARTRFASAADDMVAP